LSCDWDKWADESDEDPQNDDIDFGDMEGFGGDDDEEDSDEEEADAPPEEEA
jgi:hypothetical protein